MATNYTPAQVRGVTNTPDSPPRILVDPRDQPDTTQTDLRGKRAVEGITFESSVRTGEGVDLDAADILDGPWTIPGRGAVGDRCGIVAPNGFCEEGHVTFGRHDCGRRSCPRCWYSSWRQPRTAEAVARLGAARHIQDDSWKKRAVHVSISPPTEAIQSTGEFYELRKEALQIAKDCGIRGGLIVPHGYRIKESIKEKIEKERERGTFEGGDWKWVREHDVAWYEFVEWAPHFHVVGLSEDVDSGERPSGWVVHNIKRKRADGSVKHSLAPFRLTKKTGYRDMANVIGYILSHATFESESNRQVLTWFGSLSGINFSPDPEDVEDRDSEPELGPLSEKSWKRIRENARAVVGSIGPDESDGSGDDEEDRECLHEGCDASWHPIHKAGQFLDQAGSRLSDDAYNRVHTAYLWFEGDLEPPPGLKNPTTEDQAREAFDSML